MSKDGSSVIGNGDNATITKTGTDSVGTTATPLVAGVDLIGNHGGTGQSMPPQAGSALIDKVPAASCTDLAGAALTIDVRGQARPTGTACDIGATEKN